jgi:predicted nucleic acid-binding protein
MILDTNALSAAADDDHKVLAVLAGADEVALPVIVLGEYRYGISQSRQRTDYESWLAALLVDCTVLDVNQETTHHYADISLELRRIGKPIPTNDLWIAALARQHALTIVSRDRHFDHVPGTRRIEW